jgi:ATP-dependent DNA helicase RecG
MNYSNLLARNEQLSLYDIELLNRIQFGQQPSAEVVSYLRKKGLIEGRMPNIHISRTLAETTGQRVEYSKHKGLDEQKCRSLIISALQDHKAMPRKEIEKLLWDVLSDKLSDEQKKHKVSNLLKKMKSAGVVDNEGRFAGAKWFLVSKS